MYRKLTSKGWRFWLWGAALLLMLASAAYFGRYFYSQSQRSGDYIADLAQFDANKTVEFTIGKAIFRIPKNYLLNRSLRAGGAVDGFALMVLLPNLEPYSEANAAEFTKPGYHRKLDLLVQLKGEAPSADTQFSNRVNNGQFFRVQESRHEVVGLVRYESKLVVRDDLYVPDKVGDVEVFYSCVKEGLRPHPSCLGVTFYGGDIALQYYFSREYISDWQAIDVSIKSLLGEFFVVRKAEQ